MPTLIPERLTFEREATPLPLVVVLPTLTPFKKNETVLPAIGVTPDVKVAESVVVPP